MIKWGFIGCGDVVEKKSGKPFNLDGESEVLAVMCRTLDKAKDYATRNGVKEYYDDAEKIFSHEDIDAVYIATTPDTHMPYAKRAIEAGKAVYVEKPMGVNLEECYEVMDLAKEKNVPLFVAFYRRVLPYFVEIKKFLDDGEIGQIRSVSVIQYKKAPDSDEKTWRRVPELSGGGLFHDVGCHTLDILDFLIAPIKKVSGNTSNQRKMFDCDDTVSCSFEFENGIIGNGLWCFDVEQDKDLVTIVGNDGILEFVVFGNEVFITKNGETRRIEYNHPAFIQEPMIHNVIRSLAGKEEARSTDKTAIRTVKVMEKILQK